MRILNTRKSPKRQGGPPVRQLTKAAATLAVAAVGLLIQSYGQGTMTTTFEGPAYAGGPSPQPAGTATTISAYSESGMTFWNPYNPANLVLIGSGLSGYAANGTAYLAVTPGGDLAFSFNTFPSTYFNFVSFDAAGLDTNFPGASLEVVGYRGMIGTVTNYFTVDSFLDRQANGLPDFQTFYLGSEFQNVYRVDILSGAWSLDNVVISGVPEPSVGALAVLGAACAFWFRRLRRRLDA
jgi:hypothetical protein